MNEDKLIKILELHKKWLKNEDGGVKADLSDTDLGNINLRHNDLAYMDLSGACLINADLSNTNLSYANLTNAYLIGADLSNANLCGTNFAGAGLGRANLSGVITDEYTAFLSMQCPEIGSYIGYKKCRCSKIVELLITHDAKRSSATSRKCRASKAKVLSITNIAATKNYEVAVSHFDLGFIYRVGDIVEVEDFDSDRWDACSTGIHHFLTREETVNY